MYPRNRNEKELNLVNSRTAEVTGVTGERVSFKLEDVHRLEPQPRHLDHA